MVRPMASRWETNQSYIAGGFRGSATLVMG